jgi:hypothetical protein
MNGYEISIMRVLSIAGSTFAIGITLGWILALFHIGCYSSHSKHDAMEDEKP